MDRTEAMLAHLKWNSETKTIYDRLAITGNDFQVQLKDESRGKLYEAYLLGYQTGKSTISKQVLVWIKEGA